MEHQELHEQEDDIYGGDVPEEAYMESDFDPSADAKAYRELLGHGLFNLQISSPTSVILTLLLGRTLNKFSGTLSGLQEAERLHQRGNRSIYMFQVYAAKGYLEMATLVLETDGICCDDYVALGLKDLRKGSIGRKAPNFITSFNITGKICSEKQKDIRNFPNQRCYHRVSWFKSTFSEHSTIY
ncbi:hypothetical protein ACS0TY_018587 [Phlomoides rotata]